MTPHNALAQEHSCRCGTDHRVLTVVLRPRRRTNFRLADAGRANEKDVCERTRRIRGTDMRDRNRTNHCVDGGLLSDDLGTQGFRELASVEGPDRYGFGSSSAGGAALFRSWSMSVI